MGRYSRSAEERQPTKKCQTPQHIHPHKRRKPHLQKIHNTPQQRRHGPRLRHQILQTRYPHLHPQFLRQSRRLRHVFGLQALPLGGRGEDLWTQGAGELGGEGFDEFLEEGGEGVVGALELGFGVCEEGFEVVVGGGDAVDEVFEDEGESRVRDMLVRFVVAKGACGWEGRE